MLWTMLFCASIGGLIWVVLMRHFFDSEVKGNYYLRVMMCIQLVLTPVFSGMFGLTAR
jgi:hypothetical protein